MKRLVYLVWLLWITNAGAQSVVTDFLKHLSQIQTMQAHYTQVVHAQSQQISQSQGEMWLAKPGKFRWSTQQPVSQLIVADGKKVWVYDIDLEQVTVRKQTTDLHTGLGLLLNADALTLEKSFEITSRQQADGVVYELRAKSAHAELKRLSFQFKANQLLAMELFDTLNQQTVVHFQHIVVNKALSEQQFKFIPPKGVDILDEGELRD